MIQLDLKDAVLVEGLHPLFPKAFDYLRHADFQKIEDGKHEIDGENLFLSVQTFDGKGDDAPMEYHQAYIDIQMCIEGVEQMGWKPTSGLVEQISPYDAEKDIAFYQDKPTSVATVYPGQFAIFYPEDAHAPGMGSGVIRKVVVKVKR